MHTAALDDGRLSPPWTPSQAQWPARLNELPAPPVQLYVRGDLSGLQGAVAIVGTRHADEAGRSFAAELAADVARSGRVVISGGARGIDAAAHQGALSVGGKTVAVLASGLALPYPPAHRPLFGDIVAAGGAVVSEYEPEAPPHRWRCLRRNALVAALAEVVVVVQAPQRSGALSTARWARDLRRALLVTPAAPWDRRGAGCIALLCAGAGLCTGANDVLALVNGEGGGAATGIAVKNVAAKGIESAIGGASVRKRRQRAASQPSGLTAELLRVWRCLGAQAQHVDDLGRQLDMPAPEVQAAVLHLLLLGLAQDHGGGRYGARS